MCVSVSMGVWVYLFVGYLIRFGFVSFVGVEEFQVCQEYLHACV